MKWISLLCWSLIHLVLKSQGFAFIEYDETPRSALAVGDPETSLDFDPITQEVDVDESSLVNTTTTTAADESDSIIKTSRKRIVYLFFNPLAGGQERDSEEDLGAIFNALEPDIPVFVFDTKHDSSSIHQQCRELVESIQRRPITTNTCQPIIVASGGDGTISAVARAVINTDIPLGVIPRGTANAFATALNIPTESIEEACKAIRTGHCRRVDAAAATGHMERRDSGCSKPMILLAGIGWEANMVLTAQGKLKRILGRLAYIWGGVKETMAPKPFRCRLRINGGEQTEYIKTHSITVAVTAPSGSVSAQGSGEVIPDDGLLDVTIQTCSDSILKSLMAMAHLLKAAVIKEPTQTDTILHMRVKEIGITCRPKQHEVIDGELSRKRAKSFSYKVLPHALHVIVPSTSSS